MSDSGRLQGPDAASADDDILQFEPREASPAFHSGDASGNVSTIAADIDSAVAAPHHAAPICAPDDAEQGPAAAARLYGRAPDNIWRYGAADHRTAFYSCGWIARDGAIESRTLSWRPDLGWFFGAWAGDRPLYRFDDLRVDARGATIVCVDERSAEAAAMILPDSAVTCASGEGRETAKSDWSPLAGGSVMIWPNADSVGDVFAREVATILAAIHCAVTIVDAPALAAINPDGGVRETTQGWGPAEAVLEWSDLGALRDEALHLAKPFDPPPAYLSCPGFAMSPAGLYAEGGTGTRKNDEHASTWVCEPFEIVGAARDPDGKNWGKLLRWPDQDGRVHEHYLADAKLHGQSGQIGQAFAALGLMVSRENRPYLMQYLARVSVDSRVTRVERTGWFQIAGKMIFVLPDEVIGPCGAEKVTLDAAAHGPYSAAGTLQEWSNGVATLASGHVLAVLAIAAAFAGTLLAFASVEGGGLHFHGLSSKGKSTLAAMAASVWGGGGSPGFIRSWLLTANGAEGLAAEASDTALVLDELGQADANDAGAMLYSLANGVGKARADSHGDLIAPRSWRVMVISTGELSAADKIGEGGRRKPRAGQLVRLLDIPVDRPFGAFDHPGSSDDAAGLSKQCRQAATSAYGVAGPEFVRKLIASNLKPEDIAFAVEAFVRDKVPPKSDGQVDRAAQRLGLIAVAGELAIRFGIVPWRQDEATEAAAWALQEWIARRGGVEPAEALDAIKSARAFIESHASRFENLDDAKAEPVRNRAGWRKGEEWWVMPSVWKNEVCDGLDPVVVARILSERGMLRRQAGDNLQCTVNIGGARRARAYLLTAKLMAFGETLG